MATCDQAGAGFSGEDAAGNKSGPSLSLTDGSRCDKIAVWDRGVAGCRDKSWTAAGNAELRALGMGVSSLPVMVAPVAVAAL